MTALSALLVWVMIHRGAIDHPGARSSHTVPTPKGGGVGIAAAYAVGTLVLLYRYKVPISTMAPLCAGLLLAAVSYIDDVRPGPFAVKLGAQVGASLLVVFAGDRLQILNIAGQTLHLSVLFGAALTLAWLLFVTNAVNFIDGLNGLASGSILLGASALALVAPAPLAAQATPLIAGIAGFLPFNYPRARIFMGDVGSQICGFVAADLAVRAAPLPAASLIIPLALMPILADVAVTLLRRARAGARLTEAHRGHLYQVAHRAGIDAAKVAAVYWAMTIFGALCGVATGCYGGGMAAGLVSLALSLLPMAAWLAYLTAKATRAGITTW